MNDMTVLFLGGLAGFLVSLIPSFPHIKRIVQIHRTASFSMETNPTNNIREIVGKVLSESRSIPSLLTQTPCVLWHAEVEELRGSGENASWETVLNETSAHSFDILDIQNGTGIYSVYPTNAELLLQTDMFQEAAIHCSLEPRIMKAVEKLPIAPLGPLGFTNPLRVSEQLIKSDETVYILGTIKEKGPSRVISFSRDGSPFLISDRSQRAVLVTLYGRVLASAIPLTALGAFLARFVVTNN